MTPWKVNQPVGIVAVFVVVSFCYTTGGIESNSLPVSKQCVKGSATACHVDGAAPALESESLVASIRVSHDDGSRSAVDLTLRVLPSGPILSQGWRLSFTWLKAVVLKLAKGARTAGSFVELAPQSKLLPGQSRTFKLHISAPAMRFASDLPKSLYVADNDQVHTVRLLSPAEAHIRFDPNPPGPSGVIPRPVEADVRARDHSNGFQMVSSSGEALLTFVLSESAGPAATLFASWLSSWPADGPIGSADGIVFDIAAVPKSKQRRDLVFEEATRSEDRDWFGDEGYEILVHQREIRISAAAERGFQRAAATLRQVFGLTHSEGRSVVPPLRIRDRPRFAYRGFMLDVGRHFFDVPFLKRLLDWMHLYKLNVFHWHLTDDEGWRFEVKALPNLTIYGAWRGHGEVIEPQYGGGPHRYGGFYTHADIREVVEYAAKRGIDIVPEIDVPGHCYAAIRSLPGLLGKALRRPRNGPTSVQNFKGNALDPEAPETYEFLEAVFSEVLDVFPAPLGVHIGMDEIPRGAWSNDEAEEARLKAKLATWLQNFLSSRGRALLGWEEAFYGDSGLDRAAEQQAVALAWKEDERTASTIANAGYDVVLCPAHFLYLDIVQGMDFEDKGLYWAAQALPIDRVYSYEPMERLARLGLREDAKARIRGVSANLWGETVDSPERAEEMIFPRLLAVAEVMWSAPDLRDWGDFQWRIAPNLVWLAREAGVRHWSEVRGILAGGGFLKTPRLPPEFTAER